MQRLARRAAHNYDQYPSADPPPPPPGPGESVLTFPFTFSTPSQQLGAFAPGAILLRAELLIETPFDDAAAVASFGVVGNPVEFLDTIDVNRAGQYGSDALTLEGVGEIFLFTLTPGASSQGAGLLLWVVKNP